MRMMHLGTAWAAVGCLTLAASFGAGAQAPVPPVPAAQEPEHGPLDGLADDVAHQLAELAGGQRVELAPIEDRTPAAGPWGRTLTDLIRARVASEESPGAEDGGTWVRLDAVLIRSGPRLIVSARVVEQPSGRLRGIVSASAQAPGQRLPVVPQRPAAESGGVELVSSGRTPPLDIDVLDALLLDDERLVLLAPESVSLYRWDGTVLTLEQRRGLPRPWVPVRTPGGILLHSPEEGTLWALTSRAPRAVLFAIRGEKLFPGTRAAALPVWGLPGGLRYRHSTNLLESGRGSAPLLGFEPTLPELMVSSSGELLVGGFQRAYSTGVRVGPALAPLWPAFFATSSAAGPGKDDAILFFRREGAGVVPEGRLPLPGGASVQALASRRRGERTLLLAAVTRAEGSHFLHLFDLARPTAGVDLP